MQEPCRATQRFILSVSTTQGKSFADHHFFRRGSLRNLPRTTYPDQDRYSLQIRTADCTEQAVRPEHQAYPDTGETTAIHRATGCRAPPLSTRLLPHVSVVVAFVQHHR